METYPPAHYKQRFFEENPNFSEIKVTDESTTIGDFQEIDLLEDEVWLLQCPKGTDITQLEKQRLKLPGRTNTADLEAVAVESTVGTETHAFGYCNRKGHYALRLLPIRGNIVLRHRLKGTEALTTEKIEAACPPVKRVPLPDAIKVRHPLLGVQYTKKLELDKRIVQRLRHADEVSAQVLREALQRRAKTRSRNTSHRAVTATIELDSAAEDVEFVSETTAKKKKKKRKQSVNEGEASEEPEDASFSKKAKKTTSRKSKKSVIAALEDVSADLQWLKEL